MSQKQKKAQKKEACHKKLSFSFEESSSLDEDLMEKRALDGKKKEIENLQLEIRSLRKKLSQERQRNYDLQEVVIKGIGELQEHLKKRKTCQCSEQQQVCNSDIPATREPELGSESLGARDVPGEGLAELTAAAPTAVEAAASSSPSPAQQGLPVQAQIYVPTSSVIAQERQGAPRGGDTQNGGRENEERPSRCTWKSIPASKRGRSACAA
ncbi:uncharacterized protein LOC144097359 [Amblyomma americanum]